MGAPRCKRYIPGSKRPEQVTNNKPNTNKRQRVLEKIKKEILLGNITNNKNTIANKFLLTKTIIFMINVYATEKKKY